MNVPLWAAELAAHFWDMAGEPGPFPRDLRGPMAFCLPVSFVGLRPARISAVMAWLKRNRVDCAAAVPDR